MYKTIFLDRDGTINEEVHYLHREEDFKLLPGAAEAVRLWNENGFRVVVVTNQAGVARGYYKEEDVIRLHQYMERLLAGFGAHIDGCYYCPHHPEQGIGAYKVQCRCRKPKTGMFEEAGRAFPVDKPHSYMVGDKWSDLKAGANFGISPILVGTGYGKQLYEDFCKEQDRKAKEAFQAGQGQEAGRAFIGKGTALGDKDHPLDYFAENLYDAALWTLKQEKE